MKNIYAVLQKIVITSELMKNKNVHHGSSVNHFFIFHLEFPNETFIGFINSFLLFQ